MHKRFCPICHSDDIQSMLNMSVPTLQNRVYQSVIEAQNCNEGVVNLTHCKSCNFTFNGSFDENVIVYDEKYDNAVPSKLFIDYYESICRYLYRKYDLSKGTVYDVGCGKGTFLKMLCSLYPDVKGIGIDPSYEGNLNVGSNLVFIRDFFKAEHVTDAPSLILSRHVFEHIEYPKDFLKIIYEPVSNYIDIPVFIEVPDFGWIVENKTFWDICYEHCNYFSEKSIESMFDYTWASINEIKKSFGSQYFWIEGTFNTTNHHPQNNKFEAIPQAHIQSFIDSIHHLSQDVTQKVTEFKEKGYKIIVWGMATKGVIFTNQIDRANHLIDYCIDINTEKQNKYSPINAQLIQKPDILNNFSSSDSVLIIVMNTNYLNEIKEEVGKYPANADFIDAHGNQI